MHEGRNQELIRAWQAGATGPDLAVKYGISRQRVSQILLANGATDRQRRPLALFRFWGRVQRGPDCWLWTGSRATGGYGRTSGIYGERIAHRAAWVLTNGPIPNGMEVCHRCDNPPCVRPDHLFLGTHADNMGDMKAKGRGLGPRRLLKTHCKAGHWLPLDRLERKSGCKVCRAARDRLRPERGRRARCQGF